MSEISFNKTKSIVVLSALFLLSGLLCNVRFSSSLITTFLSSDNVLEEGTLLFLREFQVGLFSIGCILLCMGLFNASMARRPAVSRVPAAARRLTLAAILCLAAFLIYLSPYYAARLLQSDPAKYAASAFNIYAGKGFTITLNHHTYPSHVLVGYPLCVVPVYLALGPFLGNAIYVTLLSSLMMVLVTYACNRRLFGTGAALLSALLLSTNWLFIETGKEVRSDMLACFLMVLAVFLFLIIMTEKKGSRIIPLLLGAVLGFAYAVRPPNLVLLMVIPFAFIIGRGARSTVTTLSLIAAGIALVLIPYMAFCSATYGGPLRTGYQIWQPEMHEDAPFLSLRYIALNKSHLWLPPQPVNTIQKIERYLRTTNGAFYSSALLGINRLYNLAVFVFIVAGVSHSLRRPGLRRNGRLIALCLLAVIGLTFLFFMMIPFNLYRYVLPVLPLLFGFAACGMSEKVDFSYRKRIRSSSLFYLVLFAIAFSSVGFSLYRKLTRTPPPPLQYELCSSYAEKLPDDGWVISGIDSVLVDHFVLRGTRRKLFALSDNCYYTNKGIRLEPDGPFVSLPLIPAPDRLDEIRAIIDNGKIVLMDDWEDPFHAGIHAEALELMREEFVLEEIDRKGRFHLYRIRNRSPGMTTESSS